MVEEEEKKTQAEREARKKVRSQAASTEASVAKAIQKQSKSVEDRLSQIEANQSSQAAEIANLKSQLAAKDAEIARLKSLIPADKLAEANKSSSNAGAAKQATAAQVKTGKKQQQGNAQVPNFGSTPHRHLSRKEKESMQTPVLEAINTILTSAWHKNTGPDSEENHIITKLQSYMKQQRSKGPKRSQSENRV